MQNSEYETIGLSKIGSVIRHTWKATVPTGSVVQYREGIRHPTNTKYQSQLVKVYLLLLELSKKLFAATVGTDYASFLENTKA